jgi:hypothetical protein
MRKKKAISTEGTETKKLTARVASLRVGSDYAPRIRPERATGSLGIRIRADARLADTRRGSRSAHRDIRAKNSDCVATLYLNVKLYARRQ